MRIFISLFLLCSSIWAASTLEQKLGDSYLAAVNAAVVLTTDNGLSTGIYRFTDVDAEMRTYNLPLSHHFSPLTESINLFILFDIGYSDTRHHGEHSDTTQTLNFENRFQTYVIGLGGGLQYRLTEHSDLRVGGELLYSRVGLTVRHTDSLDGDVVENFFSDELNDNYTYSFFTEYDYRRVYKGHMIYTTLSFQTYKTDSWINTTGQESEDVILLSSQTSIASLFIGFETDTLYNYKTMHLSLEPFVKGSYVWGDLATIAKISSYATAGFDIYWNTPKKDLYAHRYYIEPSISKGPGFEGVNLGMGFSLDF